MARFGYMRGQYLQLWANRATPTCTLRSLSYVSKQLGSKQEILFAVAQVPSYCPVTTTPENPWSLKINLYVIAEMFFGVAGFEAKRISLNEKVARFQPSAQTPGLSLSSLSSRSAVKGAWPWTASCSRLSMIMKPGILSVVMFPIPSSWFTSLRKNGVLHFFYLMMPASDIPA